MTTNTFLKKTRGFYLCKCPPWRYYFNVPLEGFVLFLTFLIIYLLCFHLIEVEGGSITIYETAEICVEVGT